MLKIVYQVCCGIDVHKSFVYACIATTDERGVTTYKRKRLSTFSKGLRELREWLVSNNCFDVCMESTGKYWIPVYNILETMCRIVLAHPKYVKGIRGKKTDKKDAKWIADLFKHDLVNGSFIPPHDIRQLRDLIRYNFKLTSYSTGEKNRAQNCLTVSNLKLDDVFSDVFGKSATNIINHMLEHPGQPFDVSPFVHKGCKTSIEEIQAAVDGAICSEQAEKLRVIRTHLDDLDKAKANLQSAIFNIAEKFLPQINIVASVPGIRAFSAIAIIAEIGVDMSVFPTDKHLCSWAGLTPQNDESAGKKKTTRISRAGAYIKPLLVQCANAAIKSSKHPEFKKRYLKLKKRRGHKKAIIAIARMILTAIYHMLKNNEEYDPKLYNNDVDKRKPMKPDFSLEQAIAFVQSKGFSVSTISHNSTDSG